MVSEAGQAHGLFTMIALIFDYRLRSWLAPERFRPPAVELPHVDLVTELLDEDEKDLDPRR